MNEETGGYSVFNKKVNSNIWGFQYKKIKLIGSNIFANSRPSSTIFSVKIIRTRFILCGAKYRSEENLMKASRKHSHVISLDFKITNLPLLAL